MSHEATNDKLEEFNTSNNTGGYCSIRPEGGIRIDGHYTLLELKALLSIIASSESKG